MLVCALCRHDFVAGSSGLPGVPGFRSRRHLRHQRQVGSLQHLRPLQRSAVISFPRQLRRRRSCVAGFPASLCRRNAGLVVAIRLLAATVVKRLHDRNKGGWWMVPFFTAPILLGKVGVWLGDSATADFLMLVLIALSLWGFVEILCLGGATGPNRFGPDPQAPVPRSPLAPPNWDQLRELEFVRRDAGPSAGPHVMRGHD